MAPTEIPKRSRNIVDEPTTGVVGGVVGGVAGGTGGGVVGGVLGGILTDANKDHCRRRRRRRHLHRHRRRRRPPPQRIGGDVAQANLISSAEAGISRVGQAARVQGVVLLQATISKEGTIEDLKVISGHPLLNEAAIEAVRQWRYKPQMLNGQPIEVITTITVNFTFEPIDFEPAGAGNF